MLSYSVRVCIFVVVHRLMLLSFSFHVFVGEKLMQVVFLLIEFDSISKIDWINTVSSGEVNQVWYIYAIFDDRIS